MNLHNIANCTQNRQKFVEQHDYKTVPARFRWQLRSQTVSRLLLRIIQTACKTAPINSGQLERKCGKQSGGARALLFSFHLQLHSEIKTPDHFRFLISNPRKESPPALYSLSFLPIDRSAFAFFPLLGCSRFVGSKANQLDS